MNKTIIVAEVKELSMEELAFVSGGCQTFEETVPGNIEDYFIPGPPSGKNPESDYPQCESRLNSIDHFKIAI